MPEVVTVDVVSDVVCPWCFIGKRRLEAAMSANPDITFQVRWRPFQLDGTIPRTGIARGEYLSRKFGSPERIAEIYGRIGAVGAAEGLAFQFDKIDVAPNTLDAHRVLRWAAEDGAQDAVAERLFRLFFMEGGNLADQGALAAAAGEAGMDAARTAERLASDEDVQAVASEIDAAHRIGVSGVPFFIFGGKYAVSGAQDAETLAEAARATLADPA